ncbi:MAG TPA: 2-amino-4-hydroxy-6-hydroxymethyldihydropteridine diphosphokinase [Pirellulales bacterium]|nr:2-amino-4-hydroxy-6-hydroxymethyldihydropteridine diphosphokinase [Pirellulales bacterium]
MARALIALGSNLGDRKAALEAAVAVLGALAETRFLAASSWMESSHVGGPPQPDYLNGAALIETSLGPFDLLDRLQQIERAAGRVRTVYWGPRTLDLDLLLYDDAVVETDRLRLPHPRLAFRRFVLLPAAEIAPTMLHPVFFTTIAALLRNWELTKPYLALLGPPACGKTRLASEIAARTGCRLLPDPVAAGVDSAGPELAREIEFLACRSHALARQTWPDVNGWTVSDFWLAQSLAWWAAEHAEGDMPQIEDAYRGYCSQAVPARFVVAINLDGATADVAKDEFGERLRKAMRGLAGRGGLPPVLWLSTRDWEKAVVEVLAVLAG